MPNSDIPAVIELIKPDESETVAQLEVVMEAEAIKETVKEIAVYKTPIVSRENIIRGDPKRSTSDI